MIGSSGAISGTIGAFLFLFPTARIKSKIVILKAFNYDVNVPAWVYLIYWFVIQFFYQVGSVAPRINVHWGHVGGFITGLALIFVPISIHCAAADTATLRQGRERLRETKIL